MARARCILLAIILAIAAVPYTWALEGLVWPTPNRAWLNGEPIEKYVQPTASGMVSSGLFGCVRSDGMQFHEGLDLFPLQRDKNGEATDPIFAVLPGRVVYTSSKSGTSSYGRYIVIEHIEPGLVYQTLYAHLAKVLVKTGDKVAAGQTIAIMGRSAATGIPKDRAHLHLEFNLRISDNFEPWYKRQKFGMPNYHGFYHGFNFIGYDPLRLYDSYRKGEVTTMAEYIRALPTAITTIVRTTTVPRYIRRNSALLTAPIPEGGVQGWQIEWTPEGMAKLWTPLAVAPKNRLEIIDGNASEIACRHLKASSRRAGDALRPQLELLFGGRY